MLCPCLSASPFSFFSFPYNFSHKNKKDQTSEYSYPNSVVWSCLHSSHKPVSFCELRITPFPTLCQSIHCAKYEFRSIIQGKTSYFIHFDRIPLLSQIKTPILLNRRFRCAHRVIFPGRRQPSIVTVNELNYCVRNGNRCTLVTIDTHFLKIHTFKTEQ